MEQNYKEDNIKKEKPKASIAIIIVVTLIIAAFFGGYAFRGLIKEDNKKEKNEKNNNSENIEEKQEDNTPKNIEIDDNIKQLYEKYHTNPSKVNLTTLVIENYIYNSELFEIKNLQNKDVTATYGNKIYEIGKNQLESVVKYDEYNEKYYLESDAEEIIKNAFNEFFSNNLTFTHNIMSGCHVLHYHDGKYYYTPQCGDASGTVATYYISKVEKDNNNIYIYENVRLSISNIVKIEEEYSYKWTYNLKNDGNYYFLKAERIK